MYWQLFDKVDDIFIST